MASNQVPILVVQVHSAAFAIAEHVAVGTLSFPGPFPVAIFLEAVVPDVDKAVFVDVSLVIVGADARTAGNGAVYQD